MTRYLGVKYFLANQIASLVLFWPCRIGFSASHFSVLHALYRCIDTTGSCITAYQLYSIAGAVCASLRVRASGTGVLGFEPTGLAIVDLCGQLPCGKIRVSHLGNSLL